MLFKEVVSKRRSVRRFKSDPLSKETLLSLLEYAVMAPSAGNIQPWRFLVISDSAVRRRLVKAAFNQNWILQAPVLVVVTADLKRAATAYGSRGVQLYALQDTAAAAQNLLLAVVDAGLAACWVGAFSEDEVSRVLELPPHFRPVAIVPIGVPAETDNGSPGRKPPDAVVYCDF